MTTVQWNIQRTTYITVPSTDDNINKLRTLIVTRFILNRTTNKNILSTRVFVQHKTPNIKYDTGKYLL